MTTATRSVPDMTLDVLQRSTTDGNRLDLPEQLSPAEYKIIKKVINDLGGTWVRKAGTHLWPAGVDAGDAIEHVLLTGLVTDERKQFDAFYTPPGIADQVIAAAKIDAGHVVLEPSAGHGALALPALARGAHVVAMELRDVAWSTTTPGPFTEIPATGVAATHHVADRLDLYAGVDFLTIPAPPQPHPVPAVVRLGGVDRVVMNPPFSNQADMRHVLHAARFVTGGGRLAAIMSPAFMFRTTKIAAEFRAWLDEHPHDAEALPDGAFKTSGTGVRTILLTVEL